MTQAAKNFRKSMQDAEAILAFLKARREAATVDIKIEPDVLYRAGLILALASWETYIKDCLREKISQTLMSLAGSPVASIVTEQMEVDIKQLNTPDSGRTRKIFNDYVRKDVTVNWKILTGELDGWIKLRGDAAHLAPKKVGENGVPIQRPADVDTLQKVVDGLKSLVVATEAVLTS